MNVPQRYNPQQWKDVFIDFYGDEIEALEDTDNNRIWISVTRLCENLGIRPALVENRLQSDTYTGYVLEWDVLRTGPLRQGISRRLATWLLDLNALHGFLHSLDPRDVGMDRRAKLVLYQREGIQVVRAYFEEGIAVNPRFNRDTAVHSRMPMPTGESFLRQQHAFLGAIIDEVEGVKVEVKGVQDTQKVLGVTVEGVQVDVESIKKDLNSIKESQGPPGYITARGFCRMHRIDNPEAPRLLGMRCTKYCKANDIPFFDNIPDIKYGTVNSYPEAVLEGIAKDMGLL